MEDAWKDYLGKAYIVHISERGQIGYRGEGLHMIFEQATPQGLIVLIQDMGNMIRPDYRVRRLFSWEDVGRFTWIGPL